MEGFEHEFAPVSREQGVDRQVSNALQIALATKLFPEAGEKAVWAWTAPYGITGVIPAAVFKQHEEELLSFSSTEAAAHAFTQFLNEDDTSVTQH